MKMRRSAAPSKRNNFIPPIATLAGNITSSKSINETIRNTSNEIDPSFENAARSTSSLLNLLTNTNDKEVFSENSNNNEEIENRKSVVEVVNNIENSQIYNVVYGKKSGKKHKTWSGDGTLQIINKSAILKDLDGKILGRVANLKNIVIEDSTILSVGNNEVQVIELCTKQSDDIIKSNNIQSSSNLKNATKRKSTEASPSSCRSNNQLQQRRSDQILSRCIKKRKLLETPKSGDNNIQENALVMPCPPAEHQWLYNSSRKKLCEVIVDQQLSRVLRSHQRHGITFLYKCILGFYNKKDQPKCMGAILADEMGLGKTLQCITLIWTILKQGPYGGEPIIRRILIVTPSSLVRNWQNEFEKWLGPHKVRVFIVDTKNRPKDYARMEYVPVAIISYEMFIRHFNDITNIKFDLLICDEGHRLKNSSIKAATMLAELACDRRILLTGTPIQNDLQEFYTLVNFINPNCLGTHTEYRQYYEEPITRSRHPDIAMDVKVLGEARARELYERTKHFILRRTQELNNQYLPTKHEVIVFCAMSTLQKRMCQTLIDYWESRQLYNSTMYSSINTTTTTDVTHLQIITLLKKICNHPSLINNNNSKVINKDLEQDQDQDDSTSSSLPVMSSLNQYLSITNQQQQQQQHQFNIKDSSKFMTVDAILKTLSHLNNNNNKDQGQRERVVLVSYFTQTLDMFADYCNQNDYKYCRLDGSTSVDQRHDIVHRFNKSNSNEFVFLLSARAGGVGLNLIGASRLILYDSDWNPATDLQAMSRIWRDGQLNTNVYIYRLITTGSIEEKIFQRQIFKTGLSGAVCDPTNTTTGMRLSHDDLKHLFELDLESDCLTHDLLNCSCDCDGIVVVPSSSSSSSSHHKNDDIKITTPVPTTTVLHNGNDEVRDCQLRLDSDLDSIKSNLKMNELDLWQHYGQPFNDHHLLMELALINNSTSSSSSSNINNINNITFIFRNKVSTLK